MAVYNLRLKSRCVVGLTPDEEADEVTNFFMLGTTSLRDDNEIHLVKFTETSDEVSCAAILSHPNEIWTIAPCPCDRSLFFTTYNSKGKFGASLWRMAENAYEGDGLRMPLEECLRISTPSETVWSVIWDPSAEEDPEDMQVVSLENFSLRHWKIGESGNSAEAANAIEIDPTGDPFSAGAWNPHSSNLVATGIGRDVCVWDLRAKPQRAVHLIPQAHSQTVRSIDYNPDRLYTMVTGGEDGTIKFWDVKHSKEPLKVLKGHSHWTSCVKYNRLYDQLLLSSGTDSMVNLWKMFSISSAPQNDEYEEVSECEAQEDRLVAAFEEHEDSVYSVSWGDAWVYASLSYDGRLVVHQVPSAEKYSILL